MKSIEQRRILLAAHAGVCSLSHTASSRRKHSGAFEPTGTQIGKCLVGLLQRLDCDFGGNAHLGYEAQKIDAILASEIGD